MKSYPLKFKFATALLLSSTTFAPVVASYIPATFSNQADFMAAMMKEIGKNTETWFELIEQFVTAENSNLLAHFVDAGAKHLLITKSIDARMLAEKQREMDANPSSSYSKVLTAIHEFAHNIALEQLSSFHRALEAFNNKTGSKRALDLANLLQTQLNQFKTTNGQPNIFEKKLSEISQVMTTHGYSEIAKEVDKIINDAKAKIDKIKKKIGANILVVLKKRLGSNA